MARIEDNRPLQYPLHYEDPGAFGNWDEADALAFQRALRQRGIETGRVQSESDLLSSLASKLDIAGLEPTYGTAADLANVPVELFRGEPINALLSLGSALPFMDWLKGLKKGKNIFKAKKAKSTSPPKKRTTNIDPKKITDKEVKEFIAEQKIAEASAKDLAEWNKKWPWTKIRQDKGRFGSDIWKGTKEKFKRMGPKHHPIKYTAIPASSLYQGLTTEEGWDVTEEYPPYMDIPISVPAGFMKFWGDVFSGSESGEEIIPNEEIINNLPIGKEVKAEIKNKIEDYHKSKIDSIMLEGDYQSNIIKQMVDNDRDGTIKQYLKSEYGYDLEDFFKE